MQHPDNLQCAHARVIFKVCFIANALKTFHTEGFFSFTLSLFSSAKVSRVGIQATAGDDVSTFVSIAQRIHF